MKISSLMCSNYETARVVKIPSKFLSFIYYSIIILVIGYILVDGLLIRKGYQETSGIESVVVTKVKGVFRTEFTDAELNVSSPELYRRVWDAVDIVDYAHGGGQGFFVIVTNIAITPNQTRGVCPESSKVQNATCLDDSDCKEDNVLFLGHGRMTGRCVPFDPAKLDVKKTCEVYAWCPVENSELPLEGMQALLEQTKDFTVLIKNSITFEDFEPSSSYKKRNIPDTITYDYLKDCEYNNETHSYCPRFKIGDIVTRAGEKYEKVAITGGVFEVRIKWDCSFDFGYSIQDCLPEYSFARLDNANATIFPGFNFSTAEYYEENRRTLTRNYGLRIVVHVDGVGRKFSFLRVLLAIGAGMGFFGLASLICDMMLMLVPCIQNKFSWNWLEFYNEEMKYDLTYVKGHRRLSQDSKASYELANVQTHLISNQGSTNGTYDAFASNATNA